MTEGGWDRPRNLARMLRERDGNKPLAEGDDDDDNEYDEDDNIPNNDNKYAIGLIVLTSRSTSPSTRAMSSLKLSALHPRQHALRVSGQACPHAESMILSGAPAENMILSSWAESIILLALPAESMILSQHRPHAIVP
jgi:hypothetical protein